MKSMQEMWSALGTPAKSGLVIGCVTILALATALGYWAYRPDYQILFADISPRDASAMTAELDKMKTPYEIGDAGTSILVPRELVYKTRLKLMGSDVPLHGAVGFEVFNNADFGMTEFVQKVNYLRAIQGELTRTIMSIENVQSARVHLAIPEQGLFKKAVTKPKGSVTLAMKKGETLSQEQVAGIQRLIAASVPDIASADVTVLDQHGVALTRDSGDGAFEPVTAQLDSKKSTEDYLVRKIARVLDRTFGEGVAIATVDVALNLNHGKVTTEEVLPARGASSDSGPAGVVVRERTSVRDADAAAGGKPGAAGSSSSEADYQVGRRVEQMAIAGGTVRRMTVAVVVKQPLTEDQLARLKDLVASAAGASPERGDAIVVHTMGSLVAAAAEGRMPEALAGSLGDPAVPEPAAADAPSHPAAQIPAILLALLAGAALIGVPMLVRRRSTVRPASLDETARARMLADVRAWIDAPAVTK